MEAQVGADCKHLALGEPERLSSPAVLVVVVGHNRVEPVVAARQLDDNQHAIAVRGWVGCSGPPEEGRSRGTKGKHRGRGHGRLEEVTS